MQKTRVEKAVSSYFSRHAVEVGSSILVGCSGGPDSMCLLHVLTDMYDGRVGCIYFDHGIRDQTETQRECELVSSRAASRGVAFHLERAVPGIIATEARETGSGVEAAARKARYKAFYAAADRHGYAYIALGHNQDDHIETVLMRVLRGSGADGLKGIPERRGVILRPLWGLPRTDIEGYLSECDIPWASDPSNATDLYLRNIIRNHLLPTMTDRIPSARSGILSLATKMDATASSLDVLTARQISWTQSGNSYHFPAADFDALPQMARHRFLISLWNTLTSGELEGTPIPYRFFSPLADRKALPAHDGVVLRGYGGVLRRSGGGFCLDHEVVAEPVYSYLFNVTPGNSYHAGSLTVSVERTESADGSEVTFKASELSPPVILRNRRPGDKISLFSGTKSVKKLLNEWGVPQAKRWTLPIIEDRIGLVAVLEGKAGGRVAFRSKVSVDRALFDDGTVWVLSLTNTENNSEHAG